MLSPQPFIIATILAKNEADIIKQNIEHHLNQGVKKFLVTNNNSTDETRQILESFKEVEIIDEPGTDHNQSVWVTRMAHLACKFKPDWIIHLDADELCTNLQSLRSERAFAVSCQKMYLHPPVQDIFDINAQNHYLCFDHLPIPQEAKVAHRPSLEITITHGNHDVLGARSINYNTAIARHHYPIRSAEQWSRKANGHLALMNRNAICDRWKQWYEMEQQKPLSFTYALLIQHWKSMIQRPNLNDFLPFLKIWSTQEVIDYFKSSGELPTIESWSP